MIDFIKARKIISFFFSLVLVSQLSACGLATSESESLLPRVSIGVTPIIQPLSDIELLAGYLPDPRGLAYEDEIEEMQKILETKLYEISRKIVFLEPVDSNIILERVDSNSHRGMLAYWIEYAKYNEVDLLIVPYLYYYNNKENPNPVSYSNALMMSFFLIDARDEGMLLSRSHFAEEEQALDGNMLGMVSFTKRQGKALLPNMLEDAYEQMIIEFKL